MEELKKYLIRLPQSLGYREERKIKVNLYKALYYAITGEGEYLDLLFSGVPEDEIVALEGYSWPPKLNRTRAFYKYRVLSRYTHPKGQTCGRILGANEPVYRCSDCGYDDTCVMCVKCFNRDDHIDHNVSVYHSNGDSGGMCDCGDETAFTRKLNCACQDAEDLDEELPLEFQKLMKATFAVVLNYILDVTNFSINTLPLIHKNINSRGELRITSKHISDFSSLPSDVYGEEDVNSDDLWYLVLWNDENHDYLEAETGIRAATGVPDEKAKLIASEINANGRAILKVASLYSDLLKGQKLAEADGLVATIMTARDYMREVIVQHMFNWIADVTSFSANRAFRETSKSILAELLLEPDFEFSKILPAEFFQAKHLDIKKEFFKNGLLYNGELLNLGLTKLKPGVSTSSLMKSCHDLFRPAFEETLTGSRIQYLFAFEVRLVSLVRKQFSKVILPLFFSNAETKATFCEQYLEIFPTVLNILALSDREEQIASSADVSIQLFTCPRTNKWIVSNGKLCNILGPLSVLIEDHSSRVNSSGYPNLIDVVVDVRSKREKSALQKTITDTIDSFNRIVSKNDDHDILNQFLLHDNLVLFLNFQKYFQGSSTIVRKYGDHVERELLQEFYSFLQRSLPILRTVHNVAKVEELDTKHAEMAVGLILDFLSMRKLNCNAPGIAEFRVSKEPVSYTNPLNSFLSLVLQQCGMDSAKEVIKNSKFPFMHVSDFSLRSIVLASQVKIGLWIRNGVTASRQASYYTESVAELGYYRDLHLNQVACVVDDPRLTFLNFLDRWELLQWYAGDSPEDKTIYEDRFTFICEQFILFLYNVLTDRFFFDDDSSTDRKLYRKKREICYALCTEPKAYTALKTELNSLADDTQTFDTLLRECADYSPPTGLYDFGMYRLKPELYEKLDPLSIHLDSSKFLSIAGSLVANIAKNRNIDERLMVLQPEIQLCNSQYVNDHIGDFTRTKDFAKLVYKLLQVALNSEDELFLPHLLHLVHAVIIDDEAVNGPGHLADFFVTIPIGDLLLSIAESSMSTQIVLKADFLLDQFVARDSRIMESLVDCFGEDHVQAYKKRKVGLFETESEKRKRLAEERKAKVMKQFAKQREKFMEKNDINAEHEETSDEPNHKLRKCVTCGEYESIDELFGLLMCTTKSSIFWTIPRAESEYVELAFSDWDTKITPEEGKVYPSGYPYDLVRKGANPRLDATVASSCAHGMHYKCYLRAQTQLKAFPCPLCHNFHDSFIPSFLVDESQSIANLCIIGDTFFSSYNDFYEDIGGNKLEKFSSGIMAKEYHQNHQVKLEFEELMFKSEDEPQRDHEKLFELTELIADTIRANEIATRLDGTESFSNFIDSIPSSAKALLRSMIQTRTFLAISRRKSLFDTYFHLTNDLIKRTWGSRSYIAGQFSTVVALFFQTDESLQACVRKGLSTLVAYAALSLIDFHPQVLNGKTFESRHLDGSLTEDMRLFVSLIADIHDEDLPEEVSEEYLKNLYFAIERLVLPFLRQCCIFYDLITSKSIGQNEFESVEAVQTLTFAIANQDNVSSCDLLCKLLSIPNLRELISGVVLENPSFEIDAKEINMQLGSNHKGWLHAEITDIDYPGVIRLIDLPDDYNDCITDPQYKVGTGVGSICLQCGTYLDSVVHVSHIKKCSFMPIYFSPGINTFNVVIEIGDHPFEVKMPAPYLTIHGEVKKDRLPGKALLNRLRYEHLNKLWLNQGLFGVVTRSLFGMRGEAGTVPAPTDFTTEFEFEEDSDDDFGFWE